MASDVSISSPAAASASLTRADAAHENSFDLLRLLLATMVVYTHSYAIGGFGQEGFLRFNHGQSLAGVFAVLGFFGLSGFLVGESFQRHPRAWPFLRRRLRRILPGYWVCLLVTAFVLAPVIHWGLHGTVGDFPWTGPGGAFAYVWRNALLYVNQWDIRSIVEGRRFTDSLNGSLWSLFPEVCCYLVLATVGLCGVLSRRALLAVLLVVLFTFHVIGLLPNPGVRVIPATLQVTGLTPFALAFAVGTAGCAFRAHLPTGWPNTIFLGLVLFALVRLGGLAIAAPVLFPVFLLSLGTSFTLRLKHDFSYGLYIYAFPVQQALSVFAWTRHSVAEFFLLSCGASLIAAALSWFLVERPFLLPSTRRAREQAMEPLPASAS